MLGNLQGWHFIVLVVVILLLFGAPKLPGLAKSLGQSMRIFKGEMKTMKDENNTGASRRGTDSSTGSDFTSGTDYPAADGRSYTDPVTRPSGDPQNKP
jgi:sec-independent protein translocase protein TatA